MSSFGNQPQWGAQPRATGAHRAAEPQAPQWSPQGPPPQAYGQEAPQGPPQQAYGQQAPQWSDQTPLWVQGPAAYAPPPAPQQPYQEPYQAPWGLTAASSADGVRRDARSAATKQMAIGGVIALIGIALTVGTYAAASDGGHYVVAYGPAIIGVITFVKGLVGYLKA